MTVVKSTVLYGALLVVLCLTISAGSRTPSAQGSATIPAGSKVYIAPMDGFETYLKAAIEKKEVPLVVVEDRDKADFEISGVANSQKASAAKKIILGSWHSREEASVNVANIKTGEVVFAYSVHKENSAHGKKSTAEACAKHLKEKISGKQD
ncbi:MAG: hypothetical protein ACREDR_27330 [Blastocatellia bacterium]